MRAGPICGPVRAWLRGATRTPQCRTQFEHSACTVLPGRRRRARGVERRASIGPLLVVPDSFGWGRQGTHVAPRAWRHGTVWTSHLFRDTFWPCRGRDTLPSRSSHMDVLLFLFVRLALVRPTCLCHREKGALHVSSKPSRAPTYMQLLSMCRVSVPGTNDRNTETAPTLRIRVRKTLGGHVAFVGTCSVHFTVHGAQASRWAK